MTRRAARRKTKPDPVAAALSQLTAELVAKGRIIEGLRDELHRALTPMPEPSIDITAAIGVAEAARRADGINEANDAVGARLRSAITEALGTLVAITADKTRKAAA